jgi:methylmalonyl-CoA mutase
MASDPALFPKTSEDDWRRLAGAAAADTAVADDDIPIAPIYARNANAQPLSASPGWRIIQRLTAADANGAVREVAAASAGGADGVEIVFDTSVHPLKSRLPVAAAKRLATAIGETHTRHLNVRIDAGAATAAVAPAFAEAMRGGGSLVLAYDPIVGFAACTDAGALKQESSVSVAQAIAAAARVANADTVAIADGRLWHAAGASEVQELAAVLASLVAYLRASDLDPAELFPRLAVSLAADTALFPTLAKFRAMRLLVARLAELVGAAALLPIHAETAWRTTTRSEPRMNVLRGTIATLAAITGGADSLTVLPFDAAHDPTEDSRRLAANTQLIATAEAQLGRVADPGAGSGAIEALTAAFAAKAWAEFQAIEAEGGLAAAAGLRRVTTAVARTRMARAGRVVSGEMPLVGVNLHVAAGPEDPGPIADPPATLLQFVALDRQSIAAAPATP